MNEGEKMTAYSVKQRYVVFAYDMEKQILQVKISLTQKRRLSICLSPLYFLKLL